MDEWKDKVYAVELEEGVGVIFPNPKYEGSEEEFIKLHHLDMAENWAKMDEIQLPNDRNYMQAWVLKDGKIEIDLKKAKERHIDLLREERDEKLKKFDVEFMRAMESGDQKWIDNVKDVKQRLRDMPNDPIFNVDSFEKLVEAYPDCLR